MTEQLPENLDTTAEPNDEAASQAARARIALIALLFLFPLVLMLVTSIVCIAVALAKR